MNDPPDNDASRDDRVNEAIASFLEAQERGEAPDPHDFLARHADLADDLAQFFSDQARFAPQAARPAEMTLFVVAGESRGRRFPLAGHGSFIVGRSRRAQFQASKADRYCSRFHFLIEYNPPRCRLLDLASRNGTYVNRQKVEAVDLADGDLIQIGNTAFRVKQRTAQPLPVGMVPAAGAQPDSNVAGYQIVRRLGGGGMGEVHLATRLADGQQVALKTILPARGTSERDVMQFLREAQILRALDHPRIVAFHEMGQAGKQLFFTMDYVSGTDAEQILKAGGPLEIGRAVRLVCQLLEGLSYAHGKGFVHRDIKPANLLVSGTVGQEESRLADFGLARVYYNSSLSGLTMLGDVGGTVPFMAPEQITQFRDAKPPADLYSAAATLYYLLTGAYTHDFADLRMQERFCKILGEPPVPILRRRDVSQRLAAAIERGLHKQPRSRFRNAEAMRQALAPFAGLSK